MKSKPSLRKIKKMFVHMLFLLHSMRKKQSKAELKLWKQDLCSLEDSLSAKDHKKASSIACKLDKKVKKDLRKTFFNQVSDFILAIIFALLVASVIRQMCFEHMAVPTGSMRPTLLEKDHLIVAKDTYSLNQPFNNQHFIFQKDHINRMGIVVFTAEDLPMPSAKTLYFYLFVTINSY